MEFLFAGLRILLYLGIRIKMSVNHYYVGKEKSGVSGKLVCETWYFYPGSDKNVEVI